MARHGTAWRLTWQVPFEGLTMVHLDAHPDLSASTTMPAQLIMEEPYQAYAALRDDPGGIAQWILPAAYAGHLSCVWCLVALAHGSHGVPMPQRPALRWLRPQWAQQIADGDYRALTGVHVGHALAAAHPSHRDASRVGPPLAAAEVAGDHGGKVMITWSQKEKHGKKTHEKTHDS
eukprot:Skav228602  [mRNA]  locus=scaffold5678:49874:51142:+ [translate_table: standard]